MTSLDVITSSYKGQAFLKAFFKSAKKQNFKNFKIYFELIKPDNNEKKLLKKISQKNEFLKVNNHDTKIPLSEAWNRAIKRSEGDLICVWNIDDLRTIDSLSSMSNCFSLNKNISFVYGNYTIVKKFRSTKGKYVNESFRGDELRNAMILGPFFMFKRDVIKKIGLFDEQLISGADYDFAMRLARSFQGHHINKNLGYYLNTGSGLSTKKNSLQEIERTVVELRYGLKILQPELVEKAKNNYDINNIIVNKEKHSVDCFINK